MDTEYLVIKAEDGRDETARPYAAGLKLAEEDLNGLGRAGKIIIDGGLVAFPTETVYGLGGDGLNPDSSKKIYAAKGRPSDNPLIVHIANINDLYKITETIPDKALLLADKFWPGPLTMVMKKSDAVPYETTGGLNTVAVRMPDNEVALELIRQAGGYIAAPSANLSGRPSPTTAAHVREDMDGRIEMIIDAGSAVIGLESTIVDLTEDTPIILRPGYISINDLSKIVGDVIYDPAILNVGSETAPRAPGMKYRHYAPKGDLSIIKGEKEKVVCYITANTEKSLINNQKVGIIATEETYSRYVFAGNVSVKNIGSRYDEAEIARHLYSVLRDFDEEEVDVIYSEEFDTPYMGQAIMNRLIKAAGHNIVTV